MGYRLLFSEAFENDLEKLDKSIKLRLSSVFDKIEKNPYQSKQLRHYQNVFRERTGNFRLVFVVDEAAKTVTIAFIGKRDDVYRKLG